MVQDLSKKITIVLREDLISWQLTNTVGHINILGIGLFGSKEELKKITGHLTLWK